MNKYLLTIGMVALVVMGVFFVWKDHQTQNEGFYNLGDKNLGAGYKVEEGEIFFVAGLNKAKVEGADLATFTAMTDVSTENSESIFYSWAKDKNSVFYRGVKIRPRVVSDEPLDLQTVKVISEQSTHFIKDKRAVYEVTYKADNNHPNDGSYLGYQEIPSVDVDTFIIVGETCAKDKDSFYSIGYYGGLTKSKEVDPSQCISPTNFSGE